MGQEGDRELLSLCCHHLESILSVGRDLLNQWGSVLARSSRAAKNERCDLTSPFPSGPGLQKAGPPDGSGRRTMGSRLPACASAVTKQCAY